jgi:isocitrate dehydrogenase
VKLPILQVVSVADKDEEARKVLMRTIQPVRLDVVLAHPGTLQTTTVVKFQKNGQEVKRLEKRDQVVDTVLKAAGINVVVLHLTQTYSVEHITTLLGLAEDE